MYDVFYWNGSYTYLAGTNLFSSSNYSLDIWRMKITSSIDSVVWSLDFQEKSLSLSCKWYSLPVQCSPISSWFICSFHFHCFLFFLSPGALFSHSIASTHTHIIFIAMRCVVFPHASRQPVYVWLYWFIITLLPVLGAAGTYKCTWICRLRKFIHFSLSLSPLKWWQSCPQRKVFRVRHTRRTNCTRKHSDFHF